MTVIDMGILRMTAKSFPKVIYQKLTWAMSPRYEGGAGVSQNGIRRG